MIDSKKITLKKDWIYRLTFVVLLIAIFSPNFFGHFSFQGQPFFGWHQNWDMTLALEISMVVILFYIFSVFLFLFFGFIKNRIFVFGMVLFLLFLSFLEASYRSIYGISMDTNVVAQIFESTLDEKLSYVSGLTGSMVFFSLGIAVASFVFAKINSAIIFNFRKFRVYFYTAVFFLFLILATWQNSAQSIASQDSGQNLINGKSHDLGGTQLTDFLEPIPFLFPYNIAVSFKQYQHDKSMAKEINKLRLENGIKVQQERLVPEIVILVIGESSTATHWSLGHYSRKTNPKLEKQKDLVYFDKAFAMAAVTRNSVPLIVRLFTEQNLNSIYADPTLISAYKQMGFQTHWYSMQSASGPYDDTIQMLAQEADERSFLAKASFFGQSEYDEKLIERMPDLKNLQGRHLFVLHTLGSHVVYHHRYPDNFKIFQPTFAAGDRGDLFTKDRLGIERMINAYDNSIVYTDDFLNRLIEKAKDSQRNVVLGYVSDHGQGLNQNDCVQVAHDFNCLHVYQVPMLFWASQNWRSKQKEKWDYLKENSNKEVSVMGFAMTLFDLSGGSYQKRLGSYLLDQKLSDSLPLLINIKSKTIDLRKQR